MKLAILQFLDKQKSALIDTGNLLYVAKDYVIEATPDGNWDAFDDCLSALLKNEYIETCDIGCFYYITVKGRKHLRQLEGKQWSV